MTSRGWTIGTLKEHFDGILHERNSAQRDARESQQKAVDAALASAKEAVEKAEKATEHRLGLLNELRMGVATRDQMDSLAERVADLKTRLDRIEGRSSGVTQSWGTVVSLILMGIAIVGLGLKLMEGDPVPAAVVPAPQLYQESPRLAPAPPP